MRGLRLQLVEFSGSTSFISCGASANSTQELRGDTCFQGTFPLSGFMAFALCASLRHLRSLSQTHLPAHLNRLSTSRPRGLHQPISSLVQWTLRSAFARLDRGAKDRY